MIGWRGRKTNSTSVFFKSVASEKMSNRSRIGSVDVENRTFKVAARLQKLARPTGLQGGVQAEREGLGRKDSATDAEQRPGQGWPSWPGRWGGALLRARYYFKCTILGAY